MSNLKKFNPQGHVVNDGGVMGWSLIVHAPAATDELQSMLKGQWREKVLWKMYPAQDAKKGISIFFYFLLYIGWDRQNIVFI